MNFKTTVVLLILVGLGIAIAFLGPAFAPRLALTRTATSSGNFGTLPTLRTELAPDKLTRIEITHLGAPVILERNAGEWALPGKWPTRKPEVEQLLNVVAGFADSRFAPLPLSDPGDLSKYGLDQPPVKITLWAGTMKHQLALGEERAESNRFSRATFLRLDENNEVIRLAPGLVAALERPQDYYQQRRLFPSERVAKESDSQEKVDRLTASSIKVKGTASNYTLKRKGNDWELEEPVHDRVDPDKLKTILAAVPDVWAEQFVNNPKKDLAEYGLKDPERTLTVGDNQITLLVGKNSRTKTHKVMRPGPNLGGQQMPPQEETVHEEYRYAKLAGNDQIFEIKADRLKDIFVPGESLRDAQLARFRSDDVRRVEIAQGSGNQAIVLTKDKDRWRVQKPYESDAEETKLTELLDKLSGLQARDKDVIDRGDAKSYGLAGTPAATIIVTAEPKGKGQEKSEEKKTFKLLLGKHDAANKKLYVRMNGYDRINGVDDSVWPLVERPALAYHGRRVLDALSTDMTKIEVQRAGEQFTLEQTNGTWRLAAPVHADVDSSKAVQLAGDLGRLEATEYLTLSAQPKDLDQVYGLTKPVVTAAITFTDAKKPAQKLLVGKERQGKQEYFAKLESAPAVFVIKKDIHDTLNQESLAYRPLQLWQMQAADVKQLRVQKGEQEYRVKHEGSSWKISGPFDGSATPEAVKPLEDELANLRCERYAVHSAKDLATYGLDKPYLRVALVEEEKEKPKPPAKPAVKEHVLLIGKPTAKDAKTRFAKLGDSEAIVVVGEKVVAAVDHGALDLLDRKVLALDRQSINRIESTHPGTRLALERQGGTWRVLESPAPPFTADSEAVDALLGIWSNLQAQQYAAYGPKADLAAFGLDKPAHTITVTSATGSVNGKPGKSTSHVLLLGKAAEGAAGARYARLDAGPGILVLAPSTVNTLTRGYLDYVNKSVLKFDPKNAQSFSRRADNNTLEIDRRGNGWQITKPEGQRADDPTLDTLLERLGTLQATRVAGYPAKDLKTYGLDNPAAVVTVHMKGTDGKAVDHVLKIGKAIADKTAAEERFASADNMDTVVVLSGDLVRELLAPPLQFRDRNIAAVSGADHVNQERGARKASFAKVDGSWKLIQPIEAEAEQADLEEFLNGLNHLRAAELVADKPADLKPYGLDKPQARWRIVAGEKVILDLLIGAQEMGKEQSKEGQRCYAKLANGSLVFLLNPALTTRVLGEYRSRTIWAPLDASQIERLSYGYPQKPFVLDKRENEWHIAGEPESKVKAEAVKDTLDALAGLKAARYVQDTGADRQLYGLEPPQLTLEVQTPAGKRMLQIGRPEGESKRFYARVADSDQSPVFVISDADAGRIVRPLTAFLQRATGTATNKP
jgi:Domain of unknown function (DUF4340)